MVRANLGPQYDLATRLSALERVVKVLSTTPLTDNASVDANGQLTVKGIIITTDPVTGATTTLGLLPDGSYGLRAVDGNGVEYFAIDGTGVVVDSGTISAGGQSTSAPITVQLGAAAAFDPSAAGGVGAPVPGLGFITNPPQAQTAGILSPDGLSVTMYEGGPGGSGGGSNVSVGSGVASLYGWQGVDIQAKGSISIVSEVSGVSLQGVQPGMVTVDGAPIGTPVPMGYGTDLNSYTTTGNFYQNSNTNAGNGTNYPVALAGLLEVFDYSNFTHQRYTAYGNSNRTFWRALYNTTWSPWNEYQSVGEGQSNINALSPSGFSVGGDIYIEPFAGAQRVTLSLIVQSTGSTLSVTTGAYATVGTILPSAALASATAAYLLVQVVGDGLNNQAICFINPVNGACSIRAVGSNFSLGSGALWTLQYVYTK